MRLDAAPHQNKMAPQQLRQHHHHTQRHHHMARHHLMARHHRMLDHPVKSVVTVWRQLSCEKCHSRQSAYFMYQYIGAPSRSAS